MFLFKGADSQHIALSALESKGVTWILFLINMSTFICLCAFILPERVGQDYKKNWSNENNAMFSQSITSLLASMMGKLISGKCPSVWCLCCWHRPSFPVQYSSWNPTLRPQKCPVTFKEGRHREDSVSCLQTFGGIFERIFPHWKILICQNWNLV